MKQTVGTALLLEKMCVEETAFDFCSFTITRNA